MDNKVLKRGFKKILFLVVGRVIIVQQMGFCMKMHGQHYQRNRYTFVTEPQILEYAKKHINK